VYFLYIYLQNFLNTPRIIIFLFLSLTEELLIEKVIIIVKYFYLFRKRAILVVEKDTKKNIKTEKHTGVLVLIAVVRVKSRKYLYT